MSLQLAHASPREVDAVARALIAAAPARGRPQCACLHASGIEALDNPIPGIEYATTPPNPRSPFGPLCSVLATSWKDGEALDRQWAPWLTRWDLDDRGLSSDPAEALRRLEAAKRLGRSPGKILAVLADALRGGPSAFLQPPQGGTPIECAMRIVAEVAALSPKDLAALA